MKKLLFVLSFMLTIGLYSADAQCSKMASGEKGASCCAKKSAGTSMSSATVNPELIAQEAAKDKTIEATTSADGKVLYQRKAVDAKSGAVTYTKLCYDSSTGKFMDEAACKAQGKACHGEASTSMNTTKGKACVGEGAKGACCAKKGATTSVEPPKTGVSDM